MKDEKVTKLKSNFLAKLERLKKTQKSRLYEQRLPFKINDEWGEVELRRISMKDFKTCLDFAREHYKGDVSRSVDACVVCIAFPKDELPLIKENVDFLLSEPAEVVIKACRFVLVNSGLQEAAEDFRAVNA